MLWYCFQMVLLPPPTGQVYEDHIHLLTVTRNHCQHKRYALKASCYCYDSENLFYKVNYLCNQGDNSSKERSTSCVQKHTTFKCKDCLFAVYAVYKKGPPTGWVLIITNPDHNYAAKPPIQSKEGVSKEGLLNQVTAPHHQGTQARQPTKHAVKADTNAEASQQCCKQARKV